MGLLDKIRGNPIDKMDTQDIQREEIRLKNQIERIRKDINKIEKQKKQKFQEGVNADLIKKKMLAQELKQLDTEGKLKMKNFTTLHKQFTFITNLHTIKKHEKQLKSTPIWDKLSKVKPGQLESVLINMNLKGKTFEEMVDGLNRVFEMEVAEYEETEDADEQRLMDMWSQVESGTKTIDDIEHELTAEEPEAA